MLRMNLAPLTVAALRSVNGRTGALLGGAALSVYVLSVMAIEILSPARVGGGLREGPDQLAGYIFTVPYVGALGTAFGALIGWLVHFVVSRTRLAGPSDRRMVNMGLGLVVVVAVLAGSETVRRAELENTPRVILSDGTIIRSTGTLAGPVTPAMLVYSNVSTSIDGARLKWRDRDVEIAIKSQTLILGQSAGLRSNPGGYYTEVLDRVSLKGLDSVREVYGATTAAVESNGRWLALLVRLRATGRRELLLIYNPAGALAYEELLARTAAGWSTMMPLRSAGQFGEQHEFVLDLGEPLLYVVQK